jgi:transforming growth factor-beta-induced protein
MTPFAAVPAETLEALAADPEELVKVLTYHVVPGKLMAADVVNHSSADTVAGIPVDISVTDGNVMVGGANVTATDIEASNGVIHVVDAVILPPAEGEAMMEEEMMEEPMAEMDIVDTAVAAGTFNTLAQLLTDAGLVETLKGEGPFTVFAPTDDAFAAVPAETLEALAADNEQLVKVLTYHVVPGKVMAADVVNLSSADTVAGVPVAISVTDAGGVMVDNANVTATDIEASNGVIHVIDAVIIPAE